MISIENLTDGVRTMQAVHAELAGMVESPYVLVYRENQLLLYACASIDEPRTDPIYVDKDHIAEMVGAEVHLEAHADAADRGWSLIQCWAVEES